MTEEQATQLAEILGGYAWHSGGGIWLHRIDRTDGITVLIGEDVVCAYDERANDDAVGSGECNAAIGLTHPTLEDMGAPTVNHGDTFCPNCRTVGPKPCRHCGWAEPTKHANTLPDLLDDVHVHSGRYTREQIVVILAGIDRNGTFTDSDSDHEFGHGRRMTRKDAMQLVDQWYADAHAKVPPQIGAVIDDIRACPKCGDTDTERTPSPDEFNERHCNACGAEWHVVETHTFGGLKDK